MDRITIVNRINALRLEQTAGQRMLAELAAKQTEVHDTVQRITGAITILEELLAAPAGDAGATSSSSLKG